MYLALCEIERNKNWGRILIWNIYISKYFATDLSLICFTFRPHKHVLLTYFMIYFECLQDVHAQFRERLHSGECHAAHDPNLPQVFWKRGGQIYTEQVWAQRDAHRRAGKLLRGKALCSAGCEQGEISAERKRRKKNIQPTCLCVLSWNVQNAQDKEAVDKVMGDLDSNNDGEVDFTEFIILVGALTVACNDFFLEYNSKQEKKWAKKPAPRILGQPTPRTHFTPGRKHIWWRRGEPQPTATHGPTWTNTHTPTEKERTTLKARCLCIFLRYSDQPGTMWTPHECKSILQSLLFLNMYLLCLFFMVFCNTTKLVNLSLERTIKTVTFTVTTLWLRVLFCDYW